MAIVNIILKIDKCCSTDQNSGINGCPFVETQRTPNSGYAIDYFCKAAGGRKISGYVEWDSDMNPVPDWCPKRID